MASFQGQLNISQKMNHFYLRWKACPVLNKLSLFLMSCIYSNFFDCPIVCISARARAAFDQGDFSEAVQMIIEVNFPGFSLRIFYFFKIQNILFCFTGLVHRQQTFHRCGTMDAN